MRILLVSQMFPTRSAPESGIFVADLARELERRGHELAYVVPRGRSPVKHVRLAAEARRAARSFRPDVVYAHFLFPAGCAAAAAARAAGVGLVATAHGQDVRNIGSLPGVGSATWRALRSARVIAVSDFLREELVARLPQLAGRVAVIDCGVDLDAFAGRDAAEARAAVGWDGEPPFYAFLGSLDERKNPLRLAEAFARLGHGSLAVIGDGPLRVELEGRPGVRLVGRVPHEEAATWIAAADVVCQPTLVEAFGQALLEALASERSVVATRVGGPPEFVPPEAGVLVDPTSVEAIAEGLRAAAALPSPNLAAREAALPHDIRLQAEKVERELEAAAAQ